MPGPPVPPTITQTMHAVPPAHHGGSWFLALIAIVIVVMVVALVIDVIQRGRDSVFHCMRLFAIRPFLGTSEYMLRRKANPGHENPLRAQLHAIRALDECPEPEYTLPEDGPDNDQTSVVG